MQLLLLLQLCYATAAATSALPPKARHLVLLVVDDLGFGDLGYTGSGIKTPVLDGLAASGVTLGQYYVMRACSPTRASLHTGRFVIRYGMQSGVIETGQAFGLDLGETVLPQALKQAADLEAAAVGIRSREGQQQMQQQMQQQCSAGSLQRGWNCGGGGILGHLNLNLSTPTDCCAACQQLPACKVWTLYSTSRHHKRCFLKTEQCTPVLSPGSWSGGAKSWTPPPPPPAPSQPCSSRPPSPAPAPDSWAAHAVGKWHLGFWQWRSTPSFRGYDSYLGYYTGGEQYFTHQSAGVLDMRHDGCPNCGPNCSTPLWDAVGTYSTFLFTTQAERLIQAHDLKQRFFLYLAYQAVSFSACTA
jgi:hypothetical protein